MLFQATKFETICFSSLRKLIYYCLGWIFRLFPVSYFPDNVAVYAALALPGGGNCSSWLIWLQFGWFGEQRDEGGETISGHLSELDVRSDSGSGKKGQMWEILRRTNPQDSLKGSLLEVRKQPERVPSSGAEARMVVEPEMLMAGSLMPGPFLKGIPIPTLAGGSPGPFSSFTTSCLGSWPLTHFSQLRKMIEIPCELRAKWWTER